jgi:hypothetical protein
MVENALIAKSVEVRVFVIMVDDALYAKSVEVRVFVIMVEYAINAKSVYLPKKCLQLVDFVLIALIYYQEKGNVQRLKRVQGVTH